MFWHLASKFVDTPVTVYTSVYACTETHVLTYMRVHARLSRMRMHTCVHAA